MIILVLGQHPGTKTGHVSAGTPMSWQQIYLLHLVLGTMVPGSKVHSAVIFCQDNGVLALKLSATFGARNHGSK